jgi:hypothetical protein
VRACLDLEVITSLYNILISLDEYIVEMAKAFSAILLVLFITTWFNIGI